MALLVAEPLLQETRLGYSLMMMIYTFVVLSGVYSVRYTKRGLLLAATLALLVVITTWSSPFVGTVDFTVANLVLIILFLAFVARTVTAHLLKSRQISSEELYGAMSIYIILGIIWAVLYILIERLSPGSFETRYGSISNSSLVYFSFTTLTTMGLGDIVPVNPLVRVVTIVEAMTGVLYVAVLIARLVSVYTQRQFARRELRR